MLAKYNCVLSSLSVPTRALMAGNEASKQTRAFETLFGSCHLGWGWHSRSEHQGKSCFCFSLERNGKSCEYRHEREPGLDNWSLWQAFPWLCCPERGKSLTGTSQGFTDETSLKPNHERWQLMGGEKKSPKWDWLSALQITSQDVKGYLWGTRKGSVFENIVGTCIQHLKVFDPFMNCWQLLAIEVHVRIASQAKEEMGPECLDP